MLRKKEVFTTITPIPGFIPRQLAIDILHSHSEVITLNPLVLDHKPIPAPRNAAADEYYSTWYEITERIQYIPGMGKMGSGKISFNGCFHDTPWGLQTHTYAPMNIDLRNSYRIAGNQPGVEPPEPREIGMDALGVPRDGLYLREDIEIRCNVTVVSFVKSQLKAASKEMVRRIIKKAELLDAGVLKAMIYEGRLKTINPNDLSAAAQTPLPPSRGGSAPGAPYQPPLSPRLYQGNYHAVQPPPGQHNTHAPVEMPGDFLHPLASPSFRHQAHRDSGTSVQSSRQSGVGGDRRQSVQGPYRQASRSEEVEGSSPPGSQFGSPGLEHKGFAAEMDAGMAGKGHQYNPMDYANVQGSDVQG
ncbi:hypothetical protein VUR80DRAFT_8153 [Thermomyces stellatus]